VLSCMIAAGNASVAKPTAPPSLAPHFDGGHIHLYGMRKTPPPGEFW
jgi:hypothetical protein